MMKIADMKVHDYSRDQGIALVEDETGYFYAKWADPGALDDSLSLLQLVQAHTLAAIRRESALHSIYIFPHALEKPTAWTRFARAETLLLKEI